MTHSVTVALMVGLGIDLPGAAAADGTAADVFAGAGAELSVTMHLGGAYVCMEGPAFSTRAESKVNHEAGFSVIGMTNVPESYLAREAGIQRVHHNVETAESYYDEVSTTVRYEGRLRTIAAVREAGLETCVGGILNLGETREQRIREFHEENAPPVVGLREGSWLRIEGETMRLEGTAAARVFRRGEPAQEYPTGARLDELLRS